MHSIIPLSLYFFLLALAFNAQANAQAPPKKDVNNNEALKSRQERLENCLFNTIKSADKMATFAGIEAQCVKKIAHSVLNEDNDKDFELGAIAHRLIREGRTADNPYVLTPHKMNYLIPLSIVNEINRNAYQEISTWSEDYKNVEAKFQISLKIPLLTGHLFNDADQLFFGFTLQSWWQIYAGDISRPVRETNYQPEFFYLTPINYHPFGGNSVLVIGLEHQSNGHSQLLSRGWNRVYVNYLFEKRNFAFSFRPWFRIPEHEKSSPISGDGDDNPDILDYMGHFEVAMVYKYNGDFEFSVRGRNNFASHKGFVEFGATFPLWGKLMGYTQFSSGYGESLIDYNVSQNRFGLGIALTNIL
ncbi:MAG: phospholipase A [Colwellia sp.]